MKQIYGLAFLVFFSLSFSAQAQQERIAEEELTIDQLFMDANLQKLIGNTEKAIEAFKNIMESYPNHPAAAYELSRLYNLQGNSEESVKMAELAVKEDAENKWYKIFLAKLYGTIDKNREAADLYTSLIEAEPKETQHYYEKAFYLVKENDIKGALKVYDLLEKSVGMTEDIVKRKHTLYLGTGDYKKAAAELKRLTTTFPNSVEYWIQLASFYEQIDDRKSAKEVYRNILSIDPNHPKATMVLAGEDVGSSDDLSYLSSLKGVFDDPNVSIDLKIGKVMPLLQKLNQEREITLANGLLELSDILERVHPDDAKSFATAGDILMATDRFEQSIEKYERAVELDDTVFPVWEQLLFAQMISGKAKSLIRSGENAMDVYPNQATVYYNTALGYLGINDTDEAMYLLEQALMMAGKNKGLQQNIISAIGLTYTQADNLSEAKDAFTEALALNDNSPLIDTRYAFYLSKNNQIDEAEKVLKKWEKAGEGKAAFLLSKVAVLEAKGQLSEAINTMEAFLTSGGKVMPSDIESFGDIYAKSGNMDKALELWTQAQDEGIKTASLKKKITDKKL